ncbi:MAG: thioredoxin [Cryomorphaceae bacterium]|nr:MAG: thioredoxin [Cryomorphaceae bacterium]
MAIQKTDDTGFQELLESNNKVIVKYYADWCGSCKLFTPKYRRLSEDERFQGVVFLDVNAEENERARKAAGVDNLPFFAVFQNGELVEGTSTSKEEQVIALLEKLDA